MNRHHHQSNNKKITLAKVNNVLDEMTPLNTTNLWDGIFAGLENLRTNSSPDRLKFLLVFTDGIPTKQYEPIRGYRGAIEKYMDQNPDFSCVVHTYGFGYSIYSSLLNDIEKKLSGDFGFIPDSGLTGNVLIHSISNALTTAVSDVSLGL